jgi:MFS family permease
MPAQESIFFAAEALTVMQWGRASDHLGRKPILLVGAVGLAAAIISFGLSNQFWLLVISRFAQGVFNGNIGVTKAYVSLPSSRTILNTYFTG